METINFCIVTGFCGMAQDTDGFVRPQIGWFIWLTFGVTLLVVYWILWLDPATQSHYYISTTCEDWAGLGVQVPSGAILFQLGEAAQIISGGALMATPHAVRKGMPGLSRESFALFVEPHWDERIGAHDKLHALHTADAANDDVIPPLSRRLRRLPIEFGQFLSDSYIEYYSSSQKS